MVAVKKIFNKYFNGETNFMTPDVTGFKQVNFGDEILLIEFSEGIGLADEMLYGVTTLVYNLKTFETGRIELSKCFQSSKSAFKYADSITVNDFENAERYGDLKVIL